MKVVVRIFGGLGNQLFQRAAALKYADDPHYIIDEPDDSRRPGISEVLSFDEGRLTSLRQWPLRRRTMVHGRRPLGSRLRLYHSIIQSPGQSGSAPPDLGSPRRLFLRGYFHHPGFFEPRLATVCAELLASAPESGRSGDGVVAVHFRRTDFLDEGRALGLGYYRSALALVNGDRARPLWVLSDDPEYAELASDRLRADGYEVRSTPSLHRSPTLNDFWAGAFAEHLVAANSTFAWWAGVVGDAIRGTDHQVVVPSVIAAGAPFRRAHWRSAPSETG